MTQQVSSAVRAEQRELLATAVTAAVQAAELVRRLGADLTTVSWEEKSPADFVSDVDRAAEELIRSIVLARHPDAAINGEELSPDLLSGDGIGFIIDPLDGTTNFLHGYPAYAVSVAALRDGALVAGAVINVPTGELFTAVAGGGTRRSGQPVRVSGITEPARALIGTGFPFKHQHLIPTYLPQFEAVLRRTAGVRRAGSAALDLADVACGRFDAFWELMLAPWDTAAGLLLIREAGGLVTDLHGEPAPLTHGPVVAGNPPMHAWLLDLLREPGP